MVPTGTIPSLEQIGIRLTAPVSEGPPDIIPGLLPRQGQLVIAGETNIGKSLVALEICSALSTGVPLWGALQPTLQAKRILYCLGEHYDEVIRRLLAVTRLPMADEAYILGPEQLEYDKWLVSQGKPNLLAVKKFQKWAENVDLIVFDPISSFVTGVDVENDNIQMRLVLDTMSLISQTSGASCLVLAHQGKPMMDKFGQEKARITYAIRGASGIEDAATNIFYMGKGESPDTKQAQRVSNGQIIELKCRKYKGEAPPEYRLLRDPGTLTHTLLGDRSYTDILKIDTNAKIARIQASNPNIDFRTAIRLVAAFDGVAEDTIKRRIGLVGNT